MMALASFVIYTTKVASPKKCKLFRKHTIHNKEKGDKMKVIIKGVLIGSLLTVGAVAKDNNTTKENNTTKKEVKKVSLPKLDIPTTDIQM